MDKNREKNATPKPRKLDPSKVAICAAVISLVSAVLVAVVTNFDKLWPGTQPKNQAEEITAFQEYKYNEVLEALNQRAKLAEQERTAPANPAKAELVNSYLKSNRDTQLAVASKHGEFKDAVKKGDHLKAQVVKTEVNCILNKDSMEFNQFSDRGHPIGYYYPNHLNLFSKANDHPKQAASLLAACRRIRAAHLDGLARRRELYRLRKLRTESP